MRLSNFNIHHNRILVANRTGIMLSGAETGVNYIHNNHISDMGYEFNQHQGAGISLGGMTRNTHVYNNRIRNTFLYGIFDLATGLNFIYNNYVDSSGYVNLRLNLDHPFMNADSLSKVLRLAHAGNFLKNTHQGGINNIQSTTKNTRPRTRKTVVIRNNLLGANSSSNASVGNISFSNWGPAEDWGSKNIVCGNTRLDGRTPASVQQYHFNSRNPKWPVYQEDCKTPVSQIKESSEPFAFIGEKNDSNGSSSTYIIAGSLIAATIIGYYFLQRKGHQEKQLQ